MIEYYVIMPSYQITESRNEWKILFVQLNSIDSLLPMLTGESLGISFYCIQIERNVTIF